jgi:holin-like protein
MLNAIALLLLCQLCGEMLVRLVALPIPGPVIGMLLLFGWLSWRGRSLQELDKTADGLLRYLALMFVPAGVGIILYLDLLRDTWMALFLTLLLSIIITLVITGHAMQWLLKRQKERTE